MQFYLEEYGKHVEITGYRNIAFAGAEAFLKAHRKQLQQNVSIQFFDADLIATPEHLYFAVLNALQAFKNKTNLSKSPAMETILYASAQRQIQKSIDHIGIKPPTKNLAVTIIAEDPKQIESLLKELTACIGSEPDEKVLELTGAKQGKIRIAFGITDEELKTVKKDNAEKSVSCLSN